MLTQIPFIAHPRIAPDAVAVADGEPAPAPMAARPTLLLRMDFSNPQMAVLAASGDLDTATAPQLAEQLWPRLLTKLPAIVLDLRELSFLGVAGLELLAGAHTYAHHRGITLAVVNNTHTVDRALAAAELDTTLPCFASLDEACTAARRHAGEEDVPVEGGHEHTRHVTPTA